MIFDVRTVNIQAGVVLLGFAFTMIAVWSSGRHRRNIGIAAAAYAGIGAFCLFTALAEWIQEPFAIAAAYLVGCAGSLLLWRSVRVEFRHPAIVTEIALFVVVGAALLFFSTVRPNVGGRTVVVWTLIFVISILAVHELLRLPRRALQAHHVLMLSAFIGLTLLMLARIFVTVTPGAIPGYMPASFLGAAVLLAWIPLLVVLGAATLWSGFAYSDEDLKSRNGELNAVANAAVSANQEKSSLIASMSHELRTPICAVLGIADMLLASNLTQEQRRQIATLKDSERSLLVLVDDLLDLMKMEAGKLRFVPVPVNAAEAVDRVIEMLEPAAKAKGIKLRAELSATLPDWIEVDPLRLRQILVNLVHNAIKFTERGQVVVSAYRDSGQLRFEISDSGTGIPADRQHLLFKEFSQVSEVRRDGIGLGLAICRRLVEAMGGSIGVHSAPGAGSTFWFSIGLIEAAAPTAAAQTLSGDGHKKLRILFAEDSIGNQLVINALLRREGHDVVVVSSGRAALDVVKESAFDLILMDIEMPRLDGIAASRAIRKLRGPIRSIPIVALTAFITPTDRERCRRAEIDDWLMKPVDRDLLLTTVAKWGTISSERMTHDTGPIFANPVLDLTALQALERQVGRTRMSHLVDAFCRQLPNEVAMITRASERVTVRRMTHKLISASGYLGCVELTRAGQALIDAIVSDTPNLRPFIEDFASAAHDVQKALTAMYLSAAGQSPVEPAFHAMSPSDPPAAKVA